MTTATKLHLVVVGIAVAGCTAAAIVNRGILSLSIVCATVLFGCWLMSRINKYLEKRGSPTVF